MLCTVFKEVFSNAIVLSWLLCIALANCRSYCSLITQQATPPTCKSYTQLPWPGEEDQHPSRDRHTVQDIWHYSASR